MKKEIFYTALLAAVFIITGFVSCQNSGRRQSGTQTSEIPNIIPDSIMNNKPELPDNPAMAYVKNLRLGINIGNSLDAIGTATWHSGERGWGNPLIEQEYIKALKDYGYTTIRLPITWAEYMGPSPDFIITEERMSRVEEVVNWILAEDMYVIINIHHDGGHSDKSWILRAAQAPEEVADQLSKVWRQIAQRFSGISQEKLIFESMNEVGFDTLWNRYGGGAGGKREAYEILNMLNQTFVNTVRNVAGNDDRFLLIAGYWTDITLSCDPLFKMPEDTIDHRLILSVHYYTPSTFCIAEERNNSWGYRETWGTYNDYLELNVEFSRLKTNFLEKGIPIILGEYGVTLKNKDEESRIKWMAAVTQLSLNFGIGPALWDTGWKVDTDFNDHGGEISRSEPYEMRDALRIVLAALQF